MEMNIVNLSKNCQREGYAWQFKFDPDQIFLAVYNDYYYVEFYANTTTEAITKAFQHFDWSMEILDLQLDAIKSGVDAYYKAREDGESIEESEKYAKNTRQNYVIDNLKKIIK